MKKSKIRISAGVLDNIAHSEIVSDSQKLQLLKYVGYLSYDEQLELCDLL